MEEGGCSTEMHGADDDDGDWDEELVLAQGAKTNPHGPDDEEIAEILAEVDAEVRQALEQMGLSVTILPGKGRGLTAMRDYKVTETPKRCSKCKVVHYCSVEHQRKDWPVHSNECPRMAGCMIRSLPPTATMVLLGRVLDSKQRESKSVPPPGLRFRDLMTLGAKEKLHSEATIASFSQVARAFADYMGSDVSPPLDMREVIGILCRFSCNNHTICDSELRPIGAGMFPLAALANHSCVPNCTQTFRGSTIVFRAIRAISKGEEITISYIDLAGPTSLHQKVLKEKYLFDCKCEGCSDPQNLEKERLVSAVAGGEEQLQRIQEMVEKAHALAKEHSQASLDTLMRTIREAEQVLHPHHVDIHTLRESAIKAAIAVQDWRSAHALCTASLPAYRFYYPAGSPLIGLQFAMLGKVEMYLGLLEAARAHLDEACGVLRRSHGADDPFVVGVEELLRQVHWSLQGAGSFT